MAIHSYFQEIGPLMGPKPLKNREICAVGLGRRFLSYLFQYNSFNPVGFGSVLSSLAYHQTPRIGLFLACSWPFLTVTAASQAMFGAAWDGFHATEPGTLSQNRSRTSIFRSPPRIRMADSLRPLVPRKRLSAFSILPSADCPLPAPASTQYGPTSPKHHHTPPVKLLSRRILVGLEKDSGPDCRSFGVPAQGAGVDQRWLGPRVNALEARSSPALSPSRW